MHSEDAQREFPHGGLLATTADLREAYDRGVRAEIMRRNKVFKNRAEGDQADIIGWFAFNKTEAIRTIVEAGQAIINEREADA